ncbi:MAG: rod-binding protein [Defluviitaleaceae bacterium]|nr:rod-binding protein [Defluviitaleaceae bacterium]MCL2239033.1 rod-binding protein [Defluviitaleaceae bacterium]
MEIISASNTQLRDLAMTQQRHSSEIGRFQEMFAQAMDNRIDPSHEGTVLDRAAIRHAAEVFESYFIQMMFREMRKTTLNENSFIPKSHAEKIFTSMKDEEVSKQAAAAGGIGLADMIYRQMTRHLD